MPNFPHNFLFGAATAAHQVEGNNINQWSEWEKAHANVAAENAAHRYFHNPGNKAEAIQPQNYISGEAADHYRRYHEDILLLKQLGMNAYRFSIEWSRIFLAPGKINFAELNHYREVINFLLANNIQPMVTLWHFTNPMWFENLGGWTKGENINYFLEFVKCIMTEFPAVQLWVILNEPEVYAEESYAKGKWPPAYKNNFLSRRVLGNLAWAHQRAYSLIKEISPQAQVGIAKNNIYYHPITNNFIDKLLSAYRTWRRNYALLDKLNNYLDFIGINYYFDEAVSFTGTKNSAAQVSDLGWGLVPQSIGKLITAVAKRYNKPVYITENGLADKDDQYRGEYLQQVFEALAAVLDEGIDLRGYFHWSLLDNFEWAEGFWPRFGLIETDYATQARHIRPSAYKYRDLIKAAQNTMLD